MLIQTIGLINLSTITKDGVHYSWMVEGLKYWPGRPYQKSQTMVQQTIADSSKYLKYWYGSCYTMPPGSPTPAFQIFHCMLFLIAYLFVLVTYEQPNKNFVELLAKMSFSELRTCCTGNNGFDKTHIKKMNRCLIIHFCINFVLEE